MKMKNFRVIITDWDSQNGTEFVEEAFFSTMKEAVAWEAKALERTKKDRGEDFVDSIRVPNFDDCEVE